MEAICSSETSVETQRTTRRYIPENDGLQTNDLLLIIGFQIGSLCAWVSSLVDLGNIVDVSEVHGALMDVHTTYFDP
jgi:hypothetical protein